MAAIERECRIFSYGILFLFYFIYGPIISGYEDLYLNMYRTIGNDSYVVLRIEYGGALIGLCGSTCGRCLGHKLGGSSTYNGNEIVISKLISFSPLFTVQ